ncbi:alpha/beta fold hydrolase [Psychroflexus aestuariivivens]|uniref:alpha/beta fold hydrolase n=1 Tax=Psychroflexus aestuariivivens TaxID=1795040 RepID=UPI000FDC0E22|nr:alpha/beta hydrolase [Psychroflexus aestuariivivens]
MRNNDATALTHKLQDGRTLGYAEYGDQSGFPIFLFHGTPGSRLFFLQDDPISKALGIRIIATDRPGYGLSDKKAGRTVLDYPKDIVELADYLGIHKFSVIGTSGGSAYASACAYSLPDRVAFCGIVAGINQFEKQKPPQEMCKENRTAFFLSKYFPFLVRMTLSYGKKLMHTDPEKYIRSVQTQIDHLCPSDQEVMQRKESGEHVLMHMKEALRNGVHEAASEPALLAKPWGFEVSQIKIPVQIWHGMSDTLAPVQPVIKMAQEIPSCTTHFIEDKGHFLDAEEQVWKQILESVSLHSNSLANEVLGFR